MAAAIDFTLHTLNEVPRIVRTWDVPGEMCGHDGFILKSRNSSEFSAKSYTASTQNKSKQFEKNQTVSANEAALLRLRTFKKWPDNWDAEGANAPDHELLDFSMDVLSLLSNHHKDFVVHLNADSKPVFYLRNSDWSGEVVVESKETISFMFSRGSEELEDYELEVHANSLPLQLQHALTNI